MPGGSSHDRRKFKRLCDVVLEQVSKDLVAQHEPVPKQAPNRSRKVRKFSLRGVIATLVTIGGVPALIYGLQPRFSIAPQTSINPDNIFATPFVVRNTGIFTAFDSVVSCFPHLNETGASHITFEGIVISNFPIPVLEAGESGATVRCAGPFNVPSHLKMGEQFSLDFSIDGKYGYRFFRRKFHKPYRYVGVGTADGTVAFQEQPSDDPDMSNHTHWISR